MDIDIGYTISVIAFDTIGNATGSTVKLPFIQPAQGKYHLQLVLDMMQENEQQDETCTD